MNQSNEGSHRWMFLLPEECAGPRDGVAEIKRETVTAENLKIIILRHPCTGQPTKFLYDSSKKSLYEINAHKDKFSSWFVDSTVQGDGSLHVTSKFDPLFVVLPYLAQGTKVDKFVLLDQILKDDECPDCRVLSECCLNEQLRNIAECSGSGDYVGYKYNQGRTLDWLAKKAKAAATAVKDAGLFIRKADEDDYSSTKENGDMDLIEYGFGLISSYLGEDISELLKKRLNIRKRAEKRRSVEHSGHLQAKKPKNDESDKGKAKKAPKMTKAQRELSKVNKKGMKNISSFFSPTRKK